MRIQDQRSPDEPAARLRPAPPRALVFWVIWAAILAGSIVIYTVFSRRVAAPDAGGGILDWFGLAPLLGSVAVRWLVFPRFTEINRALPIFVVGLALAEGATILSTFLAMGQARAIVAVLGIAGIIMWVPVFAKSLTPPRQN